jgi:MFS family permease
MKKNNNIKNKELAIMKQIERNIFIDYIFRFTCSFDLSASIWVLYLVSKGLPLWQIGFLEGVFHIVSFLSEIPSGAIADVLGRKRAMIISRISTTIASALMLCTNSFWLMILSFALSAWGYNFLSGSEEALIYDSLKEAGKKDKFLKVSGRLEMILNISQSVSLLLGGILAEVSFFYCYLLASVISILSLIPCLFLIEPHQNREMAVNKKLISAQLVNAFQYMKKDKRVIEILLSYSIIFTLYMISYYYGQQYLSQLGFSNNKIGLIMFFVGIMDCIGAAISEKIAKNYGEYAKVISILLIALGTFGVAAGNVPIVVICFGVMGFAVTMLYPIQSEALNNIIPSEQRATIISANSMIYSMYMLVLFPMAGFLGDTYGLKIVFVGLSLVELTLTLLYWLLHTKGANVNIERE